MSITAALHRLVATVVVTIQTRLELVTVELEEELVRFASYFVYALIALYCAGVAVSLGIFLVIVLYWDEHRVAVLVTLISVFSISSVLIAAWLRNQFLHKPRLLEQSMREFKKDADMFSQRESTQQEHV